MRLLSIRIFRRNLSFADTAQAGQGYCSTVGQSHQQLFQNMSAAGKKRIARQRHIPLLPRHGTDRRQRVGQRIHNGLSHLNQQVFLFYRL